MLRTTRLTLDGYDAKEVPKDHFTTSNMAHYSDPRSKTGGRMPHKHKNLSDPSMSFGRTGSAPGHFETTASQAFGVKGRVAPSPRHQATFKKQLEQTQVFAGEEDNAKSRWVTTSHALALDTQFLARRRNPRFVHGGTFRNRSVDGLPGGRQPEEDAGVNMSPTKGGLAITTTGGTYRPPDDDTRPKPRHRFDMPQKNISTFMHASMSVPPDDPESFMPFATHTEHRRHSSAYKDHYIVHKPANGRTHYQTTNSSGYMPNFTGLVVPPGKGGHDMTASRLPIKQDTSAEMESHSRAIYRGAQLRPEDVPSLMGHTNTLGPKIIK